MADTKKQVDLLTRQPFVKEVLKIIQAYAADHRPACYAINGKWGTGKTFVLNLIHSELQQLTDDVNVEENYLVLRYNCWEYDYYDEPLLSIVATMQDALTEAGQDSKLKRVLGAVLGQAINKIWEIGSLLLDSATNGVSTKILDFIKGVKEDVNANKSSNQEFDANLPIRKAVHDLRNVIKSLSEKVTVVFLVDELDRCLPEYSIRVLERLHHIYVDEEPTDNVQVIFSVDRGQLEHVVKQLYGEDTNATSYLQKFISFEINLETGSLNEEFDTRFKSFVEQFDSCPDIEAANMGKFKARILDGYDIRHRIAIVEKADLVHRLVSNKEIDSYYMLCVALFLSVFSTWAKDTSHKAEFQAIKADAQTGTVRMPAHESFKMLSDLFTENRTSNGMIYHSEYTRFFVDDHSLLGAVLCAYRTVLAAPLEIKEADIFYPVVPYADKAWDLLTRLK